MDKNKKEILINKKEMIELKELSEESISSKDNDKEEEIPKEVQTNYNKENIENIYNTKKNLINDVFQDGGEPLGKKTMESILLNLNSYWLELLGSITLILTLIIYEFLTFAIFMIVFPFFKSELDPETIFVGLKFLFKSIGLKWIIFITINEHLSVGFFCLTTFSDVFHETMNIKRFYISNIIKVILYYILSIIILKGIIKDSIGGFLHHKIDETGTKDKEKIYQIFDNIINEFYIIVADFLSTYNTFLEKLTLGSLYIFLFYETEKKKLVFRIMSIIPVLYIIASLILRALHNTKIISINEFISPILLGPKITVYLFFIVTLIIIKYKSLSINVFDSDNYIEPKIFSILGSKIFGALGIIEFLIGLFLPSWSPVGIGGKYLLILCAPIMALYDYKKKYVVKFPFCKKGDFSRCLRITINVVGYFIIVIMGIVLFGLGYNFFNEYIQPLAEFMLDHLDFLGEIINLFS